MTITDRLAGINEGVAVKAPCVVATTANITLSGTQTIDGVAVVAGDRVLVKDQTTGSQNGIYVVSTGNWERAKDFNGSRDVVTGTKVYVISGTTNAQRDFILTTASPVIGTSSLAWDYSSNATFVTANEASTSDTDTGTSSAKIMTPRRVKRAMQTSTFYTRSGTSTVPLSITTRLGYDLDLREWATTAQLASDAATYWNNALSDINTLGGGLLRLPPGIIYVGSTVDNKYPRVLCTGAGLDTYHDAGSNQTLGTHVVATFAGTVLKHRTPYSSASARFHGGGFINLTVNGNGVATRLLEVDSIADGTYDLNLSSCVGTEAALFKCGVAATDLAEVCDIHRARGRIRVRLYDTPSLGCTGIVLTGSSTSNVCFSEFEFWVQHYNGHALDCVSADNNHIKIIATNPGGTGKTLIARGPTASHPVGCDGNVFTHVSGSGGAVYAEGTDTGGVTAGVTNIIRALDDGNGTPAPTKGTGSRWIYQTLLKGIDVNPLMAGQVAMVNSATDIGTETAAFTTETLRIRNNAGDCARLSNGSQEWQVGVDGSGNLLFARQSGSGKVNLSNGAMAYVGSLGRQAPITKTADFSVADNENWYINNKSGSTCTVTLPTASSYTGREIMIQNYQAQTVVSASSNVVPLGGGSAATAILAGTAGKWATLVSNGTNWVIMQAGG